MSNWLRVCFVFLSTYGTFRVRGCLSGEGIRREGASSSLWRDFYV
jgi:hypothetical protein